MPGTPLRTPRASAHLKKTSRAARRCAAPKRAGLLSGGSGGAPAGPRQVTAAAPKHYVETLTGIKVGCSCGCCCCTRVVCISKGGPLRCTAAAAPAREQPPDASVCCHCPAAAHAFG